MNDPVAKAIHELIDHNLRSDARIAELSAQMQALTASRADPADPKVD